MFELELDKPRPRTVRGVKNFGAGGCGGVEVDFFKVGLLKISGFSNFLDRGFGVGADNFSGSWFLIFSGHVIFGIGIQH